MTVEAAVKTFFASPRFAVAGASSDPSKFGHRILVWYLNHNLPVTPINPSCSSIAFPAARKRQPIPTVPSASSLGSNASETALSVITPPAVTRKVLQEAKQAGVRAVWLQPGSYDQEIWNWTKQQWPDAAVADFDQDDSTGFGTVGGEGWCVLVDGERGMKLAGRESRL